MDSVREYKCSNVGAEAIRGAVCIRLGSAEMRAGPVKPALAGVAPGGRIAVPLLFQLSGSHAHMRPTPQ